MLPHEDLAPWYEKAIWLYVCRTWRDDEPDLEAARIHDRFGVTSWPHLFLIHPEDDRILVRAGRTVPVLDRAFEKAAPAVEVPEDEGETILGAVEAARERVLALEALARKGARRRQVKKTMSSLEDPDVLVRLRALQVLTDHEVDELADHAESLLVDGNDAIRFELLDWIQKNEVPDLTPLLVRVFADAGGALPSGNPNVLRGRAAKCLVACGDESAIDALAPIARAADVYNSTTRVVVEALGAIADRGDDDVKARVAAVLLASWPKAVAAEDDRDPKVKRSWRSAARLAEAVRDALERGLGASRLPDPPKRWDEAARSAYVEAVTKRVRRATGR